MFWTHTAGGSAAADRQASSTSRLDTPEIYVQKVCLLFSSQYIISASSASHKDSSLRVHGSLQLAHS